MLPAEQDVVVLMRDDCVRHPGRRALLARLQAVFTQLHSVVVPDAVGCRMTPGSNISIDFFGLCVQYCD